MANKKRKTNLFSFVSHLRTTYREYKTSNGIVLSTKYISNRKYTRDIINNLNEDNEKNLKYKSNILIHFELEVLLIESKYSINNYDLEALKKVRPSFNPRKPLRHVK